MLPHPPHPREVVFELRELDLELSLGTDGVLGEDVQDQLRAVDDPRLERVLERALLRRAELVVDDQDLCLGLAVRPASAPRACPCRRTCARRGAAGAGQRGRPARPAPSAPAPRARRARRRRRPLARARRRGAHARARPPRSDRAVSPPSGGHYDSCHAHFRSRRPNARARRRALGEPPGTARDGARAEPPARRAALRRRRGDRLGRRRGAGRPRRPRRHGAGAGEPPGPDRRRSRARPRGERHERRRRGDARARARGGAGSLRLLHARGGRARGEPAARRFRERRARGHRACRRARADGRDPPRRLPGEPAGPGRVPRRERALGTAVDGTQRDPRCSRRVSRHSPAWSRSRSSSTGSSTARC